MSWIETVAEESASPQLLELLQRMRDPETRRVDNILAVHTLHPEGMDAHFRLYAAVMRGTPTLPKVDRELIALVVSKINECHY